MIATSTVAVCNIQTKYRPEWGIIIYENFDYENNYLWEGEEGGLQAYSSGGKYIIDNKTQVTSGYKGGYISSIQAGEGRDYLISVDVLIESLYKDCCIGIFVGSDGADYGYGFMIDREGAYTLTASTDADPMKYLGNIGHGRSNVIKWDNENNITAVNENDILYFYVNSELIIFYDSKNPGMTDFGVMVWGAEGVEAKNIFDNLLIKAK